MQFFTQKIHMHSLVMSSVLRRNLVSKLNHCSFFKHNLTVYCGSPKLPNGEKTLFFVESPLLKEIKLSINCARDLC